MNFRNAELALKRARFDLATTIRTDYYNFLVAKETVRVNKALVHFTDEIFRLQADLLGGGFAASHEPAALRSQAFLVRLGYKQAVANYVYAWKQLVADMGLKQLPLSTVEGQVDRLIPYYDYDAVLGHVLRNHTDVLAARNTLQGARYDLKLARVIPVPDIEVRGDVWKENTVFPFQNFHALTVSVPLGIWDRNQGNIRTASSALVRAAEGPHQVEVSLTTGLATAYAAYKTNLAAVEYYRGNILPDQVRYYRGVFERRKIDPTVAFGDLVQAQQVLSRTSPPTWESWGHSGHRSSTLPTFSRRTICTNWANLWNCLKCPTSTRCTPCRVLTLKWRARRPGSGPPRLRSRPRERRPLPRQR